MRCLEGGYPILRQRQQRQSVILDVHIVDRHRMFVRKETPDSVALMQCCCPTQMY